MNNPPSLLQGASAVDRLSLPQRRQWVGAALAGVGLAAAGLITSRRVLAADNATTIAALHAARVAETHVYFTYIEYSKRARQEGYRGVAYLFAAIAASEFVHATNFGKILSRLNEELPPIAKPAIDVRSTRENLIAGAKGEIHSIEIFYPRLLEKLKPDGHEDSMNAVRFAWAAEQQHRDKMQSILRWSGVFWEKVARTIDEKTGQYYVCQICGSTVNAIPADNCPVCNQPASNYRHVEPPALG